MTRRTLVVTNDYPPRPGGIQAFVHELASRQPAGEIVVYAPAWKRAAGFDAALGYPVIRHPTSLMLPTADVANRAADIARADGCDTVWFGAAAPLGLLAPRLRRDANIIRTVASTHGHEVGWARTPGLRKVLRQIGNRNDLVTYLGGYTRSVLAPVLGTRPRLEQLASGVDPAVFRPGSGGDEVRARLEIGDRPVVVCVSRLVPRKGQDVLVRALPAIRARVPGTVLLLVGGGPYRPTIERLARENDVADAVICTGSVPWEDLPAHYDAGDVFAMPCRTRAGGLDVEGLGIVFLEAAACGLPVVAGNSGGAPDALLPGETGELVRGADVDAVGRAVAGLLEDRERAKRLGARGREWVSEQWHWDAIAVRLRELLHAG
jgi:phosphatidylinositol alpha-1,6-mannosyltransferase